MNTYQEIKNRFNGELIGIRRSSDGASIPIAPGNRDYQEYLDWLDKGNTPQPDPFFTLSSVRDRKWGEIKEQRDSRRASGVKVGAYWYHSDDTSRIQWLGIKDSARDILAAGGAMSDNIQILGQHLVWKTLSGSFIPVTVQVAFNVNQSIKDLDATLFAIAEQKRAAVNASSTPATYDPTTGWPQTYAEATA